MDSVSLARQTLLGLEERLQRLSLVIHGDVAPSVNGDEKHSQPIATRLRSLSRALDSFEQQSKAVQDLLALSE